MLTLVIKDLEKNFIPYLTSNGYKVIVTPDFPTEAYIDQLKAEKCDIIISFWDVFTNKATKEFGTHQKVYAREYQVDIFMTNPLFREEVKERLNDYYDSTEYIDNIKVDYFDDGGHTRYDTTNLIYRNTFALGVSGLRVQQDVIKGKRKGQVDC